MLPVHVHQRHPAWPPPGSGGAHGAFGYSPALKDRPGLARGLKALLPILAIVCTLLPLSYILSDWISSSAARMSSGISSSRKLLDREPSGALVPAAPLKNLVLVAGHAVYTGIDYAEAAKESSWFLEEYQKVPGEAQSFLDHIKLGIQAAAADPDALLLFSGGQTRRAAGPRSEGLSYWVVAEAAGWFEHAEVRNRTFTEEHARDSFENLLFSLCR